MDLEADLDAKWKGYLVDDRSFQGNLFILLEEQVFVPLPTHKKSTSDLARTLSIAYPILLGFDRRLDRVKLLQFQKLQTLKLHNPIIAEIQLRKDVVDLLLRELTGAFRQQLQIKLIVDAVALLGYDLMQYSLVQLRPLLDGMAFLDL